MHFQLYLMLLYVTYAYRWTLLIGDLYLYTINTLATKLMIHYLLMRDCIFSYSPCSFKSCLSGILVSI